MFSIFNPLAPKVRVIRAVISLLMWERTVDGTLDLSFPPPSYAPLCHLNIQCSMQSRGNVPFKGGRCCEGGDAARRCPRCCSAWQSRPNRPKSTETFGAASGEKKKSRLSRRLDVTLMWPVYIIFFLVGPSNGDPKDAGNSTIWGRLKNAHNVTDSCF